VNKLFVEFLIYVMNYKGTFTIEQLDEMKFISENFFLIDLVERTNKFMGK
jgi:hypothetical protein